MMNHNSNIDQQFIRISQSEYYEVFQSMLDIQRYLLKLTKNGSTCVYVTNAGLAKNNSETYCLVVEQHFFELIKQSKTGRNVTSLHLKPFKIYVNDKKQPISYLDTFVSQIDHVLSDVESGLAKVYQPSSKSQPRHK